MVVGGRSLGHVFRPLGLRSLRARPGWIGSPELPRGGVILESVYPALGRLWSPNTRQEGRGQLRHPRDMRQGVKRRGPEGPGWSHPKEESWQYPQRPAAILIPFPAGAMGPVGEPDAWTILQAPSAVVHLGPGWVA